MSDNDLHIKDQCNHIAESFDLNVFFINPFGKVLFENLGNRTLNPIYVNQKQNFFNPLDFNPELIYDFPVIKKTVFSEKFILISIHKDTFKGTIIIGPIVSFSLSKEIINGFINDLKAYPIRDKVYLYYDSIPVINTEKIIKISSLFFYLFNQKSLSFEFIQKKNNTMHSTPVNNNLHLQMSQKLQDHIFHHDRIFEKKILDIVKEGKINELNEMYIDKEEEVASILSKSSYIRSLKNHLITLTTLVSRSAIDGGLLEEVSFSLHEIFIQKLEELNNVVEIKKMAREVLYSYTSKVHDVKHNKYSKIVNTCIEYIYKHKYEVINHETLAKHVEISPNYLSVLFKKEVGLTLSDYIQKSKIDEAKKLLAYSTTTISEICSSLNYYDQSYFTKVFKKLVGVTPKGYRDRFHLLEE